MKLFVALDGLTRDREGTLDIAEALVETNLDFGFKVNLDYLVWRGIDSVVSDIHPMGKTIFADLKMWNGKRTMIDVAEKVAPYVDYLNVWAHADGQIETLVKTVREVSNAKVLGLTVLTHYDELYCEEHYNRLPGEVVRHFAEVALHRGCDGIICPGPMLRYVEDLDTEKVVPGIRPVWYSDDRHLQAVTPGQAIDWGADKVVCGSPIMKDPDPVKSLKAVLAEMEQ